MKKSKYPKPELFVPSKEDYNRIAEEINSRLKNKRVVPYEKVYTSKI